MTLICCAYNDCTGCGDPTITPEDDYGEFVCDNCSQNRAEAAWERHQESYHDGGSTTFRSLRDQQIEALKLK